MSSLKEVWPVVLLFTGIIGGIYAGLFTASEAAAVGVILTLLLGVAMRLLDVRGVVCALVETGRTTAALFLVIIGTTLLTDYANISGAGRAISDFVAYHELTGWKLIWSFVFVCVILGIVIEGVSMIILVIPLFFPIIKAQGIDPIWFGIIFVTITEISFIVPPLGLNLFVLKATIPDIDMRELYKGILPFVVADFVRIAVLIAFPIIVLFLPSLMTR
jgi:TRAP-type C4-dicarboxylate transport system permease large subunit